MAAAPLHPREDERLASLRSYRLLDRPADPALDTIVAAVAYSFGTPMALLSLVEEHEQYFKAAVGMPMQGTSREVSFCAHAVADERPLVVPDARADPRFADNALVTGPMGLQFYAGAPVIGRDGLPLGALCVLDTTPCTVSDSQLALLTRLADAVAELLELRRGDVAAGNGSRDMLADSRRLRRAIDTGEIIPIYQPVVDLPSGRWIGVEALARWQHPQRGLPPPSTFLPVAEASGLILPLGRSVLEQACRQVADWRRRIPAAADLHLAVNISGRQLEEPGLQQMVSQALHTSGLPAHALTLELTETAQTSTTTDTGLDALRALGVRLALDDFGTGYCGMSYLQRFQPDVVKLDRCFVDGLGRSARDDLITSSLINLALSLGSTLIAQGVEHTEQARALTRLGCRNAQGYLFSKPRDPDDLEHLLPTQPSAPAAVRAS
jgi:EAL domain-containing protein (putative c-di-GMP-specific phosphodiesterase class I)